MSGSAFILVLAAAMLHATWNYHLKKANCGKALWLWVYLLTTLVSLPLLLYFDPTAFSRITPTGWMVICISAPVHVIYALILQTGYRKSDYSIVYPTARGTGPMLSVCLAIVILDNRPSVAGLIGIIAIIAGIIFLAVSSDRHKGIEKKENRTRTGIFWGTLTGICIAGYTFCDAWAVQGGTGLTPASFYFPSIPLRAVLLAPMVLSSASSRREFWEIAHDRVKRRAALIVTLGSPGGYILVLYAMSMAPLAYVAPTREIGMMVGVIIGALLLKEKLNRNKITGLVSMVLGAVLIAVAGQS